MQLLQTLSKPLGTYSLYIENMRSSLALLLESAVHSTTISKEEIETNKQTHSMASKEKEKVSQSKVEWTLVLGFHQVIMQWNKEKLKQFLLASPEQV